MDRLEICEASCAGDPRFKIADRIKLMKHLSKGLFGNGRGTIKLVNSATISFALSFVDRGIIDDSWDVGPYPDGSIVFTNKRQTKKIMVAAL